MSEREQQYFELLQEAAVFRGIPEETIPELLKKLGGYFKTYEKHETVRRAGEPLMALGIILKGSIQASMVSMEKEQIIERFHAGSIFGEAAVFGSQVSPVEIHAMEPAVLAFLPAKEILSGYKDPDIAKLGMNLLQETAKKTLNLSMKIRILKENRLRVRIMMYFRSLKPDENGVLTMNYNRTDLAQYLGANRSALCRELGVMSDEGLIRVDKRKVKILNPMIWKMMQEEME